MGGKEATESSVWERSLFPNPMALFDLCACSGFFRLLPWDV